MEQALLVEVSVPNVVLLPPFSFSPWEVGVPGPVPLSSPLAVEAAEVRVVQGGRLEEVVEGGQGVPLLFSTWAEAVGLCRHHQSHPLPLFSFGVGEAG